MTCKECDGYFICPESYKHYNVGGTYEDGVEKTCRYRLCSFTNVPGAVSIEPTVKDGE